MKYLAPVSLIAVALVAFTFLGCGSHSMESAGGSDTSADHEHADDGHADHEHGDDGHADHEHGDHEHGDHAQSDGDGPTDMEKMKTQLAKLSSEDAASAMKQHFCPVSGDMLGAMGSPIKLDVKGQQLWICCAGCKDKVLESPDEFLAKANK